MRRLRWYFGSQAPADLPEGSGMYEGWVQAVPDVENPTSWKIWIRKPDHSGWHLVLDTSLL